MLRPYIVKDFRILKETYKDFDIVVGGSVALYLQGVNIRTPKDIDIFIKINKNEFINKVFELNILPPTTNLKIDWNFYEGLEYSDVISINIDDLEFKVFTVDSIIRYKKDYIELYSNSKVHKHIKDLEDIDKYLNR